MVPVGSLVRSEALNGLRSPADSLGVQVSVQRIRNVVTM